MIMVNAYGAKKAVDEYFHSINEEPLMHRIDYSGRMIIKIMIRVYYNQKCTVCNIEISHYKKKNIPNLIWVDINSPSEDLKFLKKSHKEMMRETSCDR